jgi:DNA-binding response OmpR family regulator
MNRRGTGSGGKGGVAHPSLLLITPAANASPCIQSVGAIGFDVVHAQDVYSARRCLRGLQAGPFSLVLLDWDAMEHDRELLLHGMCLMRPRPTLALTSARLDAATCRSALARGVFAMPKPRDPNVMGFLVAQIAQATAASTRPPAAPPHAVSDADVVILGPGVTVDVAARQLVDQRGSISLRRGETEILHYLSVRRDVWVPTEAIARDVFGRSDVASYNLVWKYISDIRRKLSENSHILESSRTRGYRIVGDYVNDGRNCPIVEISRQIR